jgi:DNA-binding IscR family transcriptional regulator
VDKKKEPCPLHENYAKVRSEMITLFSTTTVYELVKKTDTLEKLNI